LLQLPHSPPPARRQRAVAEPCRFLFVVRLIVAFSGRRQLDRLLCSLGVSDSLAELQAFPERRVFRFCVGLWVGFGLTCDVSLFISFVKDFLERISGPGTILALKLRHPKNISAASTAFAIVRLDTQESASLVENAAQRNALRRGIFCLKVRPAERDIIPRPRVPMFCLENTDLHFGCLVKTNVLSFLWKAKGVAVKFGFDMKTISFYLSYNCKKL